MKFTTFTVKIPSYLVAIMDSVHGEQSNLKDHRNALVVEGLEEILGCGDFIICEDENELG